jgi:hypothetical protein
MKSDAFLRLLQCTLFLLLDVLFVLARGGREIKKLDKSRSKTSRDILGLRGGFVADGDGGDTGNGIG